MNAQQVWQSQSVDAPRMSVAYVRHAASEFDRRRRSRARSGYLLCLLVCGVLGLMSWQFLGRKPLMAASLISFGLAMLYVMHRLHRHVTAESSPADAGVLDTLRYQRRQLQRQRDWRRDGWRWTAIAVLPGYALELASMYFEADPVPWKSMVAAGVVMLAAVGLSAATGQRQARASQREIDALDSLAEGS